MLMDEPFGAIDPINRERLQNEFLRLQAEIRKTILFVTHDIDEAIKMGDRIGDPQGQGGRLAQYATPAELLMASRRRLRRGLRRGRPRPQAAGADAGPRHRPLAGAARTVGQSTREVRVKLDGAGGSPRAGDRLRAPAARLAVEADLAHDTVPQRPDSGPEPILDLDDVMRDALSDLLQAETQYAPVTDAEGRIAGVLSVEIISEFLTLRGRRSRSTRRPSARWWLSGAGSIARTWSGRDPRPLRERDCVADNGTFCFDWAVDNFDRYVTRHLSTSSSSPSRSPLAS